jgi:hypothetical protein
MNTIAENCWKTNQNSFNQLFIEDHEQLIEKMTGLKSRLIDFEVWREMYDIASLKERKVLLYALLEAADSFNLPFGFFERSLYEQEALKRGIVGPFVVIDPVREEGQLPFATEYYPLEKWREKWREYQKEGMDSEFYISEVEVAVFDPSAKTICLRGRTLASTEAMQNSSSEEFWAYQCGYTLNAGSLAEYLKCRKHPKNPTGISVVVKND